MNVRDLLERLRNGAGLPADDVRAFALGLAETSITDAQVGAFAMGVCLNGLSLDAQVALTEGMRDSGQTLQWDLPGPVVDKHSTGGVGDAVSLMLAPLLAASGAYVPMISGRGLGHTGGTLDKLEAIPGVKTQLSEASFRRIVGNVGCAIVAATPEIAPADKRLYAVRDVTGTVRSQDLITASILSKKLAAGVGALVLDVKTGSGAVMTDPAQAQALAQALVRTANGAGCPTVALVTDMGQPLLPAIGNAVEIAALMEAFETQSGRFVDLVLTLGSVVLATHQGTNEAAERARLHAALASGDGVACFGKMVAMQGGPANFVDRWRDYIDLASATEVHAKQSGYVTSIDGTALGQLVVTLGGGRTVETDKIDHSVGLSNIAAVGQAVQKGEVLAVVHCNDERQAAMAQNVVARSIVVSAQKPDPVPLVLERITP